MKPSILSRRRVMQGAISALALAPFASRRAGAAAAPRAVPATKAEITQTLRTVDDRQRNQGDWHAVVFIERKQRGKMDVVYEAHVYRRTADQKFIILFTKPKVSAGQGYLRVDKNLWFYDPAVGRWERRTERERIGGTDSRRSDYDESRLAEEYDAEEQGEEQLGHFRAQVLSLRGKAGIDLAFPVVKLWVDRSTYNVLKRQEFSLSGKLLRTGYYPRWQKRYSESKKGDFWYPEEIRFYDEVDKQDSTVIQVGEVDLKPLPTNLFTKAWLESQSR